MTAPADLVRLAKFFGDPVQDLCILAEGNVSCRAEDGGLLWIKASGAQMAAMADADFVKVKTAALLQALENPSSDEVGVRRMLNHEQEEPDGVHVPSTETFMHAYLLGLPDVHFVGHGHPTPLLSVLTLTDAEDFARRRLFPDEIVCCGPAACFVRYAAPGLPLAIKIRTAVEAFIQKWEIVPKTIWLQNHGLICTGKTAAEVISAAQMSVKAARVLLAALQTNSELRWLSEGETRQIYSWPDEHYRQKLMASRP